VEFLWHTLPMQVQVGAGGALESLICVRTELNEAGELVAIEDAKFEVRCDLVIPAIGQSPLLDVLSRMKGVKVERGRVLVDRTSGQTDNPKYFAGGDCVNGGREVVDAVADGKRAAVGMAAALSAEVVNG
jgi:dihydropyrimidine dehydrogenase (NAD+) subunit PreT